MLDKINLYNGVVTYDEFGIDLSKPAGDQTYELQQDLLQIKYKNRYIVDVGWSPMFKPQGFFLISVIEDRDWGNPLLKLKVKRFDMFIEKLQEAINFIDTFIKENPNRPLRESALD